MHRAFSIADVVFEIVQFLDHPSLANLARTASLFEQPAYSVLYETVDAECLLLFARRVTETAGDLEWDKQNRVRCLAQAKLVQSMELESKLPTAEWDRLLAAISLLRSALAPFPCLRMLKVVDADRKMLTFVGLLLCPTLESLALSLCDFQFQDLRSWEGIIFGLLDRLYERAGHISNLDIRLGYGCDPLLQGFDMRLANLLAQVCGQLRLAKIYICEIPITPRLFQSLASIDTLESVTLLPPLSNAPLDLSQYRLSASQTTTAFRALKSATLRGGAFIVEVVKSMCGAKLQSLDVYFTEWGPFMAAVLSAVCAFRHTLTDLGVSQYHISSDSFGTYIIPGHVFASLSSCSRLETVHVSWPTALNPIIDLHNSDLEKLAKSWTRLEALYIDYGCRPASEDGTPAEINATLEACIPFSLHCPKLRLMTIHPLSSTLDVRLPSHIAGSQSYGRLMIGYPWNFGDLSDPALVRIACYLDSLWPNTLLQITDVIRDNSERSIAKLNEILTHLRTARAMQVGSRWRTEQGGREDISQPRLCALPVIDEGEALRFKACPWHIIG